MAQWPLVINVEILNSLASSYGLGLSYRSSHGQLTEPPTTTYLKLLRALGLPLSNNPTDDELDFFLRARHEEIATRPLPPSVVATHGHTYYVNVHVHDGHYAHCWIRLEDGSSRDAYQQENWSPPFSSSDGITWGEATFAIPGDLPIGWHELHLESDNLDEVCTLIVVPGALSTNQRFVSEPAHGVMAQLYSVRSLASWGIGDFHDLGQLAEVVAAEGADYLLINPVHAAEPAPPVEDSPYLPTSRRFINPLYIAVEHVTEWGSLSSSIKDVIAELARPLKASNHSADPINRALIYQVKLHALRELFHVAEKDQQRRDHFAAFVAEQGEGLREFAQWCAAETSSGGRHQLPHTEEEDVRFYMWLQFIADEQRRTAQERALSAGMRIGIVTDLAVGVHPGGADAHTLSRALVPDASVGAPADQYSQQGQDWSQPPWNPHALAAQGYAAWRDLIRTVLRHSGGIRVDHILGLFRLFWVPRGGTPAEGAYMNYDHEAMLGVLALEAERAGAIVVGEDLGTFEPWVQDVLRDKAILGTSVLWFESSEPEGNPKRQSQYRNLCLTSVGTHDLPPTAGYLKGAHNTLRVELDLVDESLEELNAGDGLWINAVLAAAHEAGAFEGTTLAGADFSNSAVLAADNIEDILVGLNKFVAGTSSALTCTNLVDMVGDVRIQNQPGTNAQQYPNWRIPLTDADGNVVLIDDLASHALFTRVAAASQRRRI